MSKPLLLSSGQGKVQELVGTATGQTVVWSEGPDEWVLGTPSSSGGGGVTWYLNKNTTAGSPTTNLPTGASGVIVKNLSSTADGTSTTAASTASLPVLPADPEIIAGFVTDATVPGLTGIPAGLWDFNIWAQANGNTTNPSYIQFKVYKYDGSTAPTLLASSVPVYLYDPDDVTQYTASVLIPAGTSLLATDRIYVEVVGGSTTSNRQITLHFGNGEPSHVHTTIQVPVNLATGVSGLLPVANGGTGLTSAGSSGNLLVSDGSALASVAMSSDATIASTGALTLKNTGTAGTYGSASAVPVFVTDSKGRVTSVTNTNIAFASNAVTSLTGTANQVLLAGGPQGAITLSLPQSIATTSSPQFTGITTASAGAGGFKFQSVDSGPVSLIALNNISMSISAGAGTTGQGGTLTISGGNGFSNAGGPLILQAGSGTTNGSVSVGVTNTGSVTIGATGITTTINGTLSLANDLAVSHGGTGASSLTQYGVLVGAGTSAVQVTGAGATGQYLKSGNNAANPSFATIDVGEVTGAAPLAAPTFSGTVTIGSLSGLLRATAGAVAGSATVALGSEVSGTLPVTGGGTNNGSLSVTQGTVYYGNGSQLVGLAPGTSGQFLQSQGAAAPQWAAAGGGAGTVTSVTLDAGSTGLTISAGFSQEITTSGTFTLGGILGAGYGGTGVSSTTQSYVFAGPASASGTPSFRQLSAADITGISAPYDISGEFVGTPVASAVIMRFVAARAFTFGGTAYFEATSNTGATAAVFTVNVNGVSKGTVSIAGNATSGTGAITSTGVAAGDLFTVVATTPASVISPYWTLPGTV